MSCTGTAAKRLRASGTQQKEYQMRVNKFKDQSITLSDGSVITAIRARNFIWFSGSRTGQHRIHVMSSPARVQAHWFGYVEAAAEAARVKQS